MGTSRQRFIVFATVVYALVSLLWIFLSDQLLALFSDLDAMVWLSTVKGIFYVAATSTLFFLRSAHRARKFTSQADKFTRNLERGYFSTPTFFLASDEFELDHYRLDVDPASAFVARHGCETDVDLVHFSYHFECHVRRILDWLTLYFDGGSGIKCILRQGASGHS